MAPRQVDVTIKGKDETKAAFKATEANAKGLESALGNLLNPMALLKGAIAGIGVVTLGRFFASAVQSAADAESSWTRAASALDNVGISSRLARPEIDALATSIQKSTRFSDDAATDAIATLISVSGDYSGSLRNVWLATNLAAAKQIDLQDAAKLVGKAMIGETGTLARYGIVVEKNGDAIELMRKKFAGFAEHDGATLQGRLEQIKNAWDNLLEATGRAITGTAKTSDAASGLATALNNVGQWIDDNSDSVRDFVDDFVSLAKVTGELLAHLKGIAAISIRGLVDLGPNAVANRLLKTDPRELSKDVIVRGDAASKVALAAAHARRDQELADEKAANARTAANAKAKRDAEAAAEAHKKYLEELHKEVDELSKARDLGTLRVEDLRHLIVLEEKMLALAANRRASLAERNMAAAAAKQLREGNPLDGIPELSNIQGGMPKPGPLGLVTGIPGIKEPPRTQVEVKAATAADGIAATLKEQADLLQGAGAGWNDLGAAIGAVATGPLLQFGESISMAMGAMIAGSMSAGDAFRSSMLGALAAVAKAEADYFVGKAIAAAGDALLGNPLAIFANSQYLAAAAALYAVSGAASALSHGGGSGANRGSLNAGGFAQSAKSTENLGNVTIIFPKGKSVLRTDDPDDQDAVKAMIEKLVGNRTLNVVVGA